MIRTGWLWCSADTTTADVLKFALMQQRKKKKTVAKIDIPFTNGFHSLEYRIDPVRSSLIIKCKKLILTSGWMSCTIFLISVNLFCSIFTYWEPNFLKNCVNTFLNCLLGYSLYCIRKLECCDTKFIRNSFLRFDLWVH